MKRVVFFADAIGQALNCVAIAQVLSRQGVHCIFVADTAFRGLFEKYGFQAMVLDIHGSTADDAASHVWASHVKEGEAVFALPTLEQIDPYIVPYYEDIVDSAIHAQQPQD